MMTSGSVSTSLNSVEQTTDLSALTTLVFWNRFRNFEQLHRRLKDMPYYTLNLPPKRFLSSSLDNSFVRERCILLDKYLKVSVGTSILTGLDMYSLPAIFVDKRQKFVSMFLLNSYRLCSIEGWSFFMCLHAALHLIWSSILLFMLMVSSTNTVSASVQSLLAIPSVAELHEVWDFLSVNSQVFYSLLLCMKNVSLTVQIDVLYTGSCGNNYSKVCFWV